MRGILIGVWLFVALLILPGFFCAPALAQTTATVTATVSVRPPKVSLTMRAQAPEKLQPTRFATVQQTRPSIFTAFHHPYSHTLSVIRGEVA